MSLGTIKKLFTDKHCGFISPTLAGPDVFFHGSIVTGGQFAVLQAGQRVEYEIDAGSGQDDRGPRASRVRPIHAVQSATASQQTEFRQLRRHHASRAKKPTWRKKGD